MTMPKPYSLATIRELGREHGEEAAGAILAETPDISADDFSEAVSAASESMRQYSPFEFHAAAINARRPDWQADRGWEVYEANFDIGVKLACHRAGREDLA
jgi:hypothetical protein